MRRLLIGGNGPVRLERTATFADRVTQLFLTTERSNVQFKRMAGHCLAGWMSALIAGSSGALAAGSNPATRGALPPPLARAAAPTRIIYSVFGANEVDVTDTAGTLIAAIKGIPNPQKLAADAAGNIYVTATGGTLVYKNDFKTLLATLSNANRQAENVAVDSRSGVVGVVSQSTGGHDVLDFYAKSGTAPCNELDLSPYTVSSQAFDGSGNDYVIAYTASRSSIIGVVAAPGCSAKAVTVLKERDKSPLPNTPVGVRITPGGQIAILYENTSSFFREIYSYDPPVNGVLGKPVGSTPVPGVASPVEFVFSQNGNIAYTSDLSLPGILIDSITRGKLINDFLANTYGLAVTPIAQPK